MISNDTTMFSFIFNRLYQAMVGMSFLTIWTIRFLTPHTPDVDYIQEHYWKVLDAIEMKQEGHFDKFPYNDHDNNHDSMNYKGTVCSNIETIYHHEFHLDKISDVAFTDLLTVEGWNEANVTGKMAEDLAKTANWCVSQGKLRGLLDWS